MTIKCIYVDVCRKNKYLIHLTSSPLSFYCPLKSIQQWHASKHQLLSASSFHRLTWALQIRSPNCLSESSCMSLYREGACSCKSKQGSLHHMCACLLTQSTLDDLDVSSPVPERHPIETSSPGDEFPWARKKVPALYGRILTKMGIWNSWLAVQIR